MKKILITLLFSASFAFASDALMSSMHNMESGLGDIQKGFLYNQVDLIKVGAKRIQDANKIFHNPNSIQKFLPAHKKHMIGVTLRQAKRIDNATASLIDYVKAKDMSLASDSYSDIINACSACHKIVRGW